MKRRLRDKLVLLVRQRDGVLCGGGSGGKGAWAFPHVAHQEGETIRVTAERALRECAGAVEAFFIGNAPMAHYPLGGAAAGEAAAADGGAAAPSGGGGGGGGSGGSGGSGAPGGAHALHTAGDSDVGLSGGAVFFMLAQAVNDPWEVVLEEGFASGHAWVAADELGEYLGDDRLAELARRML
jgi:hypothetical protein